MIFVMTENRPGWVEEVRALKKMFHSLHTDDVKFVLNPTTRVFIT